MKINWVGVGVRAMDVGVRALKTFIHTFTAVLLAIDSASITGDVLVAAAIGAGLSALQNVGTAIELRAVEEVSVEVPD